MQGSLFQSRSSLEQPIAHLFVIVGLILTAILILVTVLVIWATVRFRYRPGQAEPRQVFGHKYLEVGWTAGPILLLAIIFALTLQAMEQADPSPTADDPPDLVIVGHQWWWEARYLASHAVTANEIHIPAGRRLRVRLEAADVIHDWWVPQLGRKMDAIPGYPNSFWIEADQPGTFEGSCAEYCGADHAWMRIRVITDSPPAFDAWIQHQLQPAPQSLTGDAAAGAQLFESLACSKCHEIHGVTSNAPPVEIGPDLTHFAERQTIAADRLTNTPENLSRWLRDPQAVKPGCYMPNFQLTEEQVRQLTSYLEALK